jgi:hypothetical protein
LNQNLSTKPRQSVKPRFQTKYGKLYDFNSEEEEFERRLSLRNLKSENSKKVSKILRGVTNPTPSPAFNFKKKTTALKMSKLKNSPKKKIFS